MTIKNRKKCNQNFFDYFQNSFINFSVLLEHAPLRRSFCDPHFQRYERLKDFHRNCDFPILPTIGLMYILKMHLLKEKFLVLVCVLFSHGLMDTISVDFMFDGMGC